MELKLRLKDSKYKDSKNDVKKVWDKIAKGFEKAEQTVKGEEEVHYSVKTYSKRVIHWLPILDKA